MKPIHHQITALAVLLALLPGILGIGLINHFCSTCQHAHKEAAMLVWHHDHEDESCACEWSDNHDTCEISHLETHHHHHQCQVEVKRLIIPIVSPHSRETVPPRTSSDIRLEIFPFGIYSTFAHFYTTQRRHFSPPVLQHGKGTQRLSVFGVFRLWFPRGRKLHATTINILIASFSGFRFFSTNHFFTKVYRPRQSLFFVSEQTLLLQ